VTLDCRVNRWAISSCRYWLPNLTQRQFSMNCIVRQATDSTVCRFLQIIQQQTPISRVEVRLAEGWRRLRRSGDGFWEPGHELHAGPVVSVNVT
jgi:hypothetical protein